MLCVTALLVGVAAAPPSGTSQTAPAGQPREETQSQGASSASADSRPPSDGAASTTASAIAATSPPAAPPLAGEVPATAPATGNSAAQPAVPQAAHGLKDWVHANSRATRGAIVGAVTGTILGILSARAQGVKAWKGALAGGLTGAIAGYALGRNQDRLAADRDQAVRLAGYDPSQGYLLRLDSFQSEPTTVAPGGSVTLSVRYLVIGPDPRERLTVQYFRGIKYQDTYLNGNGPIAYVVPNGGGIVSATWSMTLPKDAPAGSYAVEELIEDPNGRYHVSATTPLYIAPANG